MVFSPLMGFPGRHFWQRISTVSFNMFLFTTGIKFQSKNWNSYMKLVLRLYWMIILEKLELMINYHYIEPKNHSMFKFTKELKNIQFQINSIETMPKTCFKEIYLKRQWLSINIWSWKVHNKCKLFIVTWGWYMKDKRTYLKP